MYDIVDGKLKINPAQFTDFFGHFVDKTEKMVHVSKASEPHQKAGRLT